MANTTSRKKNFCTARQNYYSTWIWRETDLPKYPRPSSFPSPECAPSARYPGPAASCPPPILRILPGQRTPSRPRSSWRISCVASWQEDGLRFLLRLLHPRCFLPRWPRVLRLKGTVALDFSSNKLCSLAGRYENPIPIRFLAPTNCFKIPAQEWVQLPLNKPNQEGEIFWRYAHVLYLSKSLNRG